MNTFSTVLTGFALAAVLAIGITLFFPAPTQEEADYINCSFAYC